jgi:hypothetical protein
VAWARWLAAALAAFEAGYMVLDGTRSLITGSYFTPSRGAYAGQLGPWTRAVRGIGIEPESRLMKSIFVVYGASWLVVALAFPFMTAGWAWAAMLVLAVGSLWYLVIGTITSALVIVLLLLPGVRP